ncbi:hypothetical protein K491DRAFT_254766 [Lophiostoma macrostomum CBS 122681]|uniref:Uncharacterized protein n=1 Tax=Lophiostoma macrostomum CBS 122681 TaxID=1314788 RepID=A0A6A6SQ23_9PLEO|nr:hypothetical protein K491DRAFT_254766 [Lophiostoma macrostomum CBS 122681]
MHTNRASVRNLRPEVADNYQYPARIAERISGFWSSTRISRLRRTPHPSPSSFPHLYLYQAQRTFNAEHAANLQISTQPAHLHIASGMKSSNAAIPWPPAFGERADYAPPRFTFLKYMKPPKRGHAGRASSWEDPSFPGNPIISCEYLISILDGIC